jgi:hypothetical protein
MDRFIRFGARVFHNLRLFATFKRKARKAREKYWHIQEKRIIVSWIDWIRIKGPLVSYLCVYKRM